MDSGNSGSMQSSSGGDEEFDSRAESISAFLSSSSTNPHHHQHQHHQQQQQQPQPPNPTILFDPLSNYLSHHDPFSTTRPSPPQNPNNSSLLHNLDMAWSNARTNTLRSDPNYTHFNTSLMATASSSSPTPTPPPPPPTHLQGSTGFSPLQTHQQAAPPHHHHNTSSSSLPPDRVTSARNSKKRSRASRRAPTTVLTTDTSNFRAMVQEFTGIPAPPFSASPFPRTRFDLFNNSSSSTMRSGLVEPSPPSYLLRPFAQKLHPPSFLSSSFSPSSSTSTNTVTPTPSSTTNHNTTNSTSPNNYQLLSELGLSNKQSTHHQNLLNMHNPSLTFQSLLQSSPPTTTTTTTATTTATSKYPSTIPTTSHNSQLKMGGVLEDFGMNNNTATTNDHHHVRNQMSGIPNLLSTTLDPMSSMRSDNHHNTLSWRDGVGSNDEDQHNLRPFNGNNFDNSRRAAVNGCKSTTTNYSGSSPDFNAEKGSSAENNNNNVSSRGEGMVDSWICSSD